MKYCPNCGAEVEKMKFCSSCGTNLQEEYSVEEAKRMIIEVDNITSSQDKIVENTIDELEEIKPSKVETSTNSLPLQDFIPQKEPNYLLYIVVILLLISISLGIRSNDGLTNIVSKITTLIKPTTSATKNDGKKNFKVARIKYEVTGTASSVSITLTNPGGGIEQYSNVKIPGSYEFSVPIQRGSFNYYHASISAQNNGSRGDVTVTIYVNGKKFRTSTSSGAYVIASADAAIEYKDVVE
jgi:hypothetical protein